MADTNFSTGTVITKEWLNEVNSLRYGQLAETNAQNIKAQGTVEISGSTAKLIVHNSAEADFHGIELGAGTAATQRRYIKFRDFDGNTDMLMGCNAVHNFIVFSDTDVRHYISASEVAGGGGGALQINSGGSGQVQINIEPNSSNGGFHVYSGGAVPDRWHAIDGQGIRIFIGGLQFAALASAPDIGFFRASAGALEMRSDTTAQNLRIHGTYTDASNFERLNITSGSSYDIFTTQLGTGVARALRFGTGGTLRWQIGSSTGHLTAVTDNTYDIGNSGALRPRDLFAAGKIVISGTSGSAIGAATSSTTALNLAASAAGISPMRIPHGTAPSSPVDGDIWTTTAGLFVRINGATVGPLT